MDIELDWKIINNTNDVYKEIAKVTNLLWAEDKSIRDDIKTKVDGCNNKIDSVETSILWDFNKYKKETQANFD